MSKDATPFANFPDTSDFMPNSSATQIAEAVFRMLREADEPKKKKKRKGGKKAKKRAQRAKKKIKALEKLLKSERKRKKRKNKSRGVDNTNLWGLILRETTPHIINLIDRRLPRYSSSRAVIDAEIVK